MVLPSIKDIEKDARRGLRVTVDHVHFRDYKWHPHLEVKIAIESVRQLPLRIIAVDLYLSYNSEEVGPLPSLTRPYEITEPGESIEIRMRKDLYPTLVEEMTHRKRTEDYFQVRGLVLFESPDHAGFLEFPVDLTYTMR